LSVKSDQQTKHKERLPGKAAFLFIFWTDFYIRAEMGIFLQLWMQAENGKSIGEST